MRTESDRAPRSSLDLDALRRRDPTAIEAWFEEHADGVYSFVFYRIQKDENAATDLVQDTFMTALRKIDDFDPKRGSMQTWLTLLARNGLKTELQRRGQLTTIGAFWDTIDERLAATLGRLESEPLPGEALERDETTELVHMAMAHLPDHYRRVLNDHYYRDRSLKVIASAEDISEAAAKSLLHRARLAFKRVFQTLTNALDGRLPNEEAAR